MTLRFGRICWKSGAVPNYFLMGSKRNYIIGHEEGAWRGGAGGDDVLSSPLYTGDVEVLRRDHAVRDTRIVL